MEDVEDGFGNVIKKGMQHFEGIFLEKKFDSKKQYTIPKKAKTAFFYRESIVFPSVQLQAKKGHYELSDDELLMIIKYVEVSHQASLF